VLAVFEVAQSVAKQMIEVIVADSHRYRTVRPESAVEMVRLGQT